MKSVIREIMDFLGLTGSIVAIAAVFFWAGMMWAGSECPNTYVYIPRPDPVERSVIKSRTVTTHDVK